MNFSFARIIKWAASALVATAATTAFANAPQLINGAGATFPYPIYSKWFHEYTTVDPSIRINYQSIGSGGGIRQLLDNTVDFGASDAPMKDTELAKSDIPILHIPTVLGAVVVSYNIPGVDTPLKLSAEVIQDIFMGKITKWNDAKIQALNPDVKLPEKLYILVVHRSDGSGTTAVFTDYLAKVSPTWKQKVGYGKAVKWPTGIGGKGNEGVAGVIKKTPGAIGYLELIYAKTNKLPAALIQNDAGKFIEASTESVSFAADAALPTIPEDYRVSITNPKQHDKAYPISAFTYLLVYQQMPAETGGKIVEFLSWAVSDGQQLADGLSYAKLPDSLVVKVKETIASIKLQ